MSGFENTSCMNLNEANIPKKEAQSVDVVDCPCAVLSDVLAAPSSCKFWLDHGSG